MEISSRNNEKIIELRKSVKDKSLIVLDTPKLINEAISRGVTPKAILATNKFENQFENSITVTDSIIKLFSSVETSPGIIALIEYNKQALRPPNGTFLVLDTVQDPGNVGTLLRSAQGAGFNDVYLINCASITNNKVVRSAMGATFTLNLFEMQRNDFIKLAKENSLNLIMADMDGKDIFEEPITSKNVGLVLGNEGSGVSDDIAVLCKSSIKIPMQNNLESLNVAISGSIIMFQISYGGNKK